MKNQLLCLWYQPTEVIRLFLIKFTLQICQHFEGHYFQQINLIINYNGGIELSHLSTGPLDLSLLANDNTNRIATEISTIQETH